VVAEEVANVIVIGSVVVAWVALGLALWRIWRYGPWWRNSLGVITFGTLSSYCFWLFVFLGLVLYGEVNHSRPLNAAALRIALAVGLMVTGVGTNVALGWYRRKYLQ
jgi:hypothetical protein